MNGNSVKIIPGLGYINAIEKFIFKFYFTNKKSYSTSLRYSAWVLYTDLIRLIPVGLELCTGVVPLQSKDQAFQYVSTVCTDPILRNEVFYIEIVSGKVKPIYTFNIIGHIDN